LGATDRASRIRHHLSSTQTPTPKAPGGATRCRTLTAGPLGRSADIRSPLAR